MKLAKEYKFSENKQIFLKSLFFVLSIYLLINGIIFIWDSALIVDALAIFSLVGVFLVATPMYFFLKSNIKKFWRYLANMTIVHIILFLVEFVTVYILDHNGFFTGLESMCWLVSSIVALLGFGIILLIDLIYNLCFVIFKVRK
jgi:hypothetical protein